MKPIDRDIYARYPALASYVMRLGQYSGITASFLAKQGVTHSRDQLDSRTAALAVSYGYGKDTTRFLRDIATGRTVDFKAYSKAWEHRMDEVGGNNGKSAWRYVPGERMTSSDPFFLTFKGKSFVMNKRAARRNFSSYGTSDYKVRGRFGLGNGKRAASLEVAPGKLPARDMPRRSLRKPKSKRRSHRPSAGR